MPMTSEDSPGGSLEEVLQHLNTLGSERDLGALWREFMQARSTLWPSLDESERDQINDRFRELAYGITGVSSMEELRPLILAAGTPPADKAATTPTEPQPVAERAATVEVRAPVEALAQADGAGLQSSVPKPLLIAAVGALALVVVIVIALAAMGSGASDGDGTRSAVSELTPAATRSKAGTAADTASPTATSAGSPPAASTSGAPTATPEPKPVLIATGEVNGTFQHVVAVITGDCSPLQLSSGPVRVGSVIPGSSAWGLGVGQAGSSVLEIHSADGLTGQFNSDDLSFEVQSADGSRKGDGVFNAEGTSFNGKSYFTPGPGCMLELDSTATFDSPLFRYEVPATASAGATPGPTSAAPAQAAAPSTQAPLAPTQPPAPTATTAPNIPALIQAAVLGEYTQAQRTASETYLVSHLDASAIAFYGQQACETWFAGLIPDSTFAIQISSITGPAPWTWQIFGETVGTIQDVYTVQAQLTQYGNTFNAAVHFAWNTSTQQLRIFSPCRGP
jgi:hypothetical protein